MADIIQTAVDAGQFTTLAELLTKTGLVEELKKEGPFTVFAPTDEAFAKVDEATLASLTDEQVKSILLYHVIEDEFTTADLLDYDSIEAANGDELTLTDQDGLLLVNSVEVGTPDVDTDNGIIHIIDTVLMPPAKAE